MLCGGLSRKCRQSVYTAKSCIAWIYLLSRIPKEAPWFAQAPSAIRAACLVFANPVRRPPRPARPLSSDATSTRQDLEVFWLGQARGLYENPRCRNHLHATSMAIQHPHAASITTNPTRYLHPPPQSNKPSSLRVTRTAPQARSSSRQPTSYIPYLDLPPSFSSPFTRIPAT